MKDVAYRMGRESMEGLVPYSWLLRHKPHGLRRPLSPPARARLARVSEGSTANDLRRVSRSGPAQPRSGARRLEPGRWRVDRARRHGAGEHGPDRRAGG